MLDLNIFKTGKVVKRVKTAFTTIRTYYQQNKVLLDLIKGFRNSSSPKFALN